MVSMPSLTTCEREGRQLQEFGFDGLMEDGFGGKGVKGERGWRISDTWMLRPPCGVDCLISRLILQSTLMELSQ